MSRGICSPEDRASCPVMRHKQKCFTDKHHLFFEAFRAKTKLEKQWRDEPFNKIDIPRCIHNAIHASGYKPEKPERETMLSEVWNNDAEHPPLRAMVERETQLLIAQKVISQDWPPKEAA